MVDTKIEKRLISLGICPNLLGFGYIIEAIKIIIAEPNVQITSIYWVIAERNDVGLSSVERCIRYAISNIDTRKWQYGKSDKISNSKFLFTLAKIIKMEEENEQCFR